MTRAKPDVMNHRSAGPRYVEILVSKAIRSPFSCRIVGDAAVGWFMMICHQFSVRLGEGVMGSEFRTVGGLGPDMVLVNMWIMPQRMSMWRVSKAYDPSR